MQAHRHGGLTHASPAPSLSHGLCLGDVAVRRRRSSRAMRQQLHAAAPSNRVFQTDSGSWVVAPSMMAPSKGVVHFLGGAFAGAAPQLLYSLLLDMVASAGYTAVATPYAITFKHDECAEIVRAQFLSSLAELRRFASMEHLAPTEAPLLGMGHSMGSHLHLLIGSYHPAPYVANVLMSYNNKQVSDAIPIPGLLDALGPSVQAARAAAAAAPIPITLPTGSEALAAAASFLPPVLREVLDGVPASAAGTSSGSGFSPGGRLSRAGLALDQLGRVVDEVGDGGAVFVPSPEECRRLVKESYSVDRTLLVRFTDDGIDETAGMEALLRPKLGGRGISTLLLPGSHVTPCGGDSTLLLDAIANRASGSTAAAAAAPLFVPDGFLDAASRLVVSQTQADVRRLGSRVVGWLDSCCLGSGGNGSNGSGSRA